MPTGQRKEDAKDIAQVRESMNQARNEKQKSMLLKEAVRLGKERFLRAAEESRKLCEHARGLQAKRANRNKS